MQKVLSLELKTDNEVHALNSRGKEFHNAGAEKENYQQLVTDFT